MIDFFASATIALIVTMTIVLYFANRRQAKILKEMRLVMEDWYQAKMRDRRESFRKQFKVTDGMKWLGDQVNLHLIEQGRKLENPRAIEYFSTEGIRLVISPDKKRKLRSELRSSEGKRRKVAKLVEPLLGYKPRKVQMIERSNKTAHEWFDLEISAALKKLKIQWGEIDCLYFYLVPQRAIKQNENMLINYFQKAGSWVNEKVLAIATWFRQRIDKVSG